MNTADRVAKRAKEIIASGTLATNEDYVAARTQAICEEIDAINQQRSRAEQTPMEFRHQVYEDMRRNWLDAQSENERVATLTEMAKLAGQPTPAEQGMEAITLLGICHWLNSITAHSEGWLVTITKNGQRQSFDSKTMLGALRRAAEIVAKED